MNLRIKLVLIIVGVFCVLPVSVTAQDVRDREAAVCEVASERRSQVDQSFSNKIATFDQRVENVQISTQLKRQEVDEALISTHHEFDEKYHSWHTIYMDKVSDTDKRAAAEEFYANLQQLVAIRRQAYAQARQVYRSQIDDLRRQRQSDMSSSIQAFKQSSNSSFTVLESACGRIDNTKQMRTDFISSLQEARLTYAQYRRTQVSYKDLIHSAQLTRDHAFELAKKQFELDVQAALSAFKEVDSDI